MPDIIITNFNDITQANRLVIDGRKKHYASVEEARRRQWCRGAAREYRKLRRRHMAEVVLDICLGATAAITALAAVGFLMEVL